MGLDGEQRTVIAVISVLMIGMISLVAAGRACDNDQMACRTRVVDACLTQNRDGCSDLARATCGVRQ